VRYTLAAALDTVLRRGKGGSGAADAFAMPPLPEAGHVAIDSGLACPVGGGGDGDGEQLNRLTTQMYDAMEVDERTAIVYKHLPGATLRCPAAAAADFELPIAPVYAPPPPLLQLRRSRHD
jgi:hypothetical protein